MKNKNKSQNLSLIALAVFLFSCPSLLMAKEFNVTNIGDLRLAITEANQTGEDDVIHLAAGTYLIEGASDEDENATGDLDIKSNISVIGDDARNTILEGNGADRIVHVQGNANATVENLTIRNGLVDPDTQGGGGIYVLDSTLLLKSMIIVENVAAGGGGLYSKNSELKVLNSLISKNETQNGGGGGILNTDSDIEIINSTISENISKSSGGGIYLQSGTATILNSTITGNGALSSGGEGITDGGADISLGNTIVAGNTSPPNSNADYEGIFTSLGGNIIGNNGETNPIKFIIINNQQPSDQIGTDADPIDPMLGPLQNNGGPTDTHELLAGSPALNMGEDGICEPEDQRGVVRPLGGKCDSGAFEVGCGDGTKEANEACDDGNNTDGDGCSSICKLESTGGGGGGNNNSTSAGGCGQINRGPMNGLGYGVVFLASLIALAGLRRIKY